MRKNVKKFLVTALSGLLLSSISMGVIAPSWRNPSADLFAYAAEADSSSGSNANTKPNRMITKSYSDKTSTAKINIQALNDQASVKPEKEDLNKNKDKDKDDKDKDKDKEEGKDDEDGVFTKEKIADFAKDNVNDWVGGAFELIEFIKGAAEGEEVDWAKFGVETAKTVVFAIAAYFGYGEITKTIVEGLENLLTNGDEPLSEMELLSDMLEQEFAGMNDTLYDIETELGRVSYQITDSVNQILSGTQMQIESVESKEILRKFMSSGEGNFSYNEFSNYLYGSNASNVRKNEAYYNLLMQSIYNGEGDDVVGYYYDKLFDSLYSNVTTFSEYYFGSVAGLDKSVVAHYYDYLVANPWLVAEGSTAEYEAIAFAFELYTSYTYAYSLMEMCFAYQVTDMNMDALAEGRKALSDADYYQYNDTDRISYGVIKAEIAKMQDYMDEADIQIVKNINYIMGMSDSYLVMDENGTCHEELYNDETFGNVVDGQTIYLNVLTDELIELYSLRRSQVGYYINGERVLNAQNEAVIDVASIPGDVFTVTMKYMDEEIYTITFQKNVEDTFAGGDGCEEHPYLIANARQLKMVENDLSAHYRLIADIDVNGAMYTMGSEEEAFSGTFNGNGYKIERLTVYSLPEDENNVTRTPITGLFACLTEDAEIKNLTLENYKVSALEDDDGVGLESDRTSFYIGGLVGINEGTIINCSIVGNSSIEFTRSKSKASNRTLSVSVGGIAGENSGVIGYCSIDGLEISADTSSFEFGANSAAENKNKLYAGGIAGHGTGAITHCRVSENTSVKAYAAAIANTDSKVNPYATIQVGGITGDVNAKDSLIDVYSACKVAACGYVYNEGTYWGVHRYSMDNLDLKEGVYYPLYVGCDEDQPEDLAKWEEYYYQDIYYKWLVYYQESFNYRELASRAAKEEIIEKVNTENEGKDAEASKDFAAASYTDEIFNYVEPAYFTLLIPTKTTYDVGSAYIETDTLLVYNAEGERVDATILGCYGFDSSNPSFTETKDVDVTIFYLVNYDGQNIFKYDTVTFTIKENALDYAEISGFMETPLQLNASEQDCLNAIYNDGFDIALYYLNGEKTIVNVFDNSEVTISGIDTSKAGKVLLTIAYGEIELTVEAVVACDHLGGYVLDSHETADCKHMGYDVYKCMNCGDTMHKNYYAGDHTYVVVDGSDATCHEPGYTQSVICSVCDKVFTSSEWIQALPHEYITVEEAETTVAGFVSELLYANKDYHYCVNGGHYEPHQYVVTESSNTDGKIMYIYSCITCGYVSEVVDENIMTDAAGDIPVVFVTDGYVLQTGDEVVVYVQLINNPGFNGANFGIRYTEGLKLVSYEESTIVPAQLRVNNEVYNGYNFLWATGSGDSLGDGYLLKLTFKYIATNGTKQTVDIVYGMQEDMDEYGESIDNLGGFTSASDKNVISRFMTHSGTISLVDHLPGDVNSDSVVDIMDATMIAWSIVGKTDAYGNKITVEKRYADVNLDGKVDLNDVVAVLQSISGRYGTNLLNSEYKLILNLAGYTNGNIETSIDVKYYDENGLRTKWNSNVDFAAVEAEMNRRGYTFVGWYTRLEGGTLVDINGNISYDDMQGTQTLYARWEKNKIVFDMSGANGEAFEDIIYSDADSVVETETPEWSYDIEYIVENYGLYGDDTYQLYKEFLGWYIGDTLVTEYDLSTPNLGTVTLVAKWADVYTWETPSEERAGYADISKWYFKQAYNTSYQIITMDDAMIAELAKTNFTIYGQENIIRYTITYANDKGATNANNDYFYVTSDFALANLDSVTGYDFAGWYDQDGNKIVRINERTGDITLNARWNAKVYEVTVKGTDVNDFTVSSGTTIYSATDKTLFTLYYRYEDGFYLESNCANALPGNYFNNYCAQQNGYNNFTIEGCYTSMITNNAHSYASVNSGSLVLKADTSLVKLPELSENTRTGTLYAKLMPKKYTVTLNQGAENLIDNQYLSGTFKEENLSIAYDASNHTYTMTNINASDPHVSINQWANLEAGVEYMMHMDIASTTGKTNVQVFYAINQAYTEANSRSFHSSSSTATFTVPTSGKYWFRIDNDCDGAATISNFWVSKARTESVEVYYNETLPTVTTPTSIFYNFAGYMYNGSVNYYGSNGVPAQPYVISGDAAFVANWSQKYSGTYVKTAAEYRNIKNKTSAAYYLLCDIDLLKEHWTPIGSFTGTIDGLGHTLYGLSYEFIGGSGDYTQFGMFRTFSGTVRNLTIDAPRVHTEKSKDGKDNDYTGVIAGQMTGGTISGVTIINPNLFGGHYRDVTNGGTYVNSYVGGFVGQMSAGTISNCSISGGKVAAWAAYPSGDADGHAFAGGIVGHMTGGTVSGCSRADSAIIEAKGEQNTGIKTPNSAIRAAAGGLVGSRDSGTVRGTSSANNLVSTIVTGKNASSYSWARKEAIVGTGGQG